MWCGPVRSTPRELQLTELALAVKRRRQEMAALEGFLLGELFEAFGRDMLAKGQSSKTLPGDVRLFVRLPREKEYCPCHRTLLYQCPTPIDERGPALVFRDALPDFWISAAKDE